MSLVLASLLAVSGVGADVVPDEIPAGTRKYPPELPGATVETYKRAGDVELKMYVFQPEDAKKGDARPAIVFFFGGGWRSGSPGQFYPQCRYLASRGLVAVTADYRVKNRHGVAPQACVADAKSAVRYVRANAERLGVDPERIVASGGSAGGHVAACAGIVAGFEDENSGVGSVPNALALYNPAVMLAPLDGADGLLSDEKIADLRERTGGNPEEISPIHHLRKGLPPTIVFHGTNDDAVPFATVEEFAARSRRLGNRCELVAFEGRPHGFFNLGRNEKDYVATTRKLEAFLVSLGYARPAGTP